MSDLNSNRTGSFALFWFAQDNALPYWAVLAVFELVWFNGPTFPPNDGPWPVEAWSKEIAKRELTTRELEALAIIPALSHSYIIELSNAEWSRRFSNGDNLKNYKWWRDKLAAIGDEIDLEFGAPEDANLQ